MAAYKVIQDIEAEDKLLGPLTLRQFIYALIAVACFYFTFLLVSKGIDFLAPLFLLPGLFAAFFAIPWSREQPTEVWALAKIRFFLKPRRRIWDQSGIKELVTITVPKKIERNFTNGLDQMEVRSRLTALANTLDSRGWAVKNVNVNLSAVPGMPMAASSDRLLDASTLPQEVPNYDVTAADDILDETNNPVASQFDKMINVQAKNHRQQIVQHMKELVQQQAGGQAADSGQTPPAGDWFTAQTTNQSQAVPAQDYTVTATAEEEAVAARAMAASRQMNKQAFGHLKTLEPIDRELPPPLAAAPVVSTAVPAASVAVQPQPLADAQQAVQAAYVQPAPTVTAQPDPAIIKLANNNDLNVATIARQAQKEKQAEADEVVVSLH